MPKPLTYSEYVHDRPIVEALDLPAAAVCADAQAREPGQFGDWRPGDDWPVGPTWVHDEVLFIRTHQAFEVWFALIVHELASVVREAANVVHGFEDPRLAERQAGGALLLDHRSAWPKTVAVIDLVSGENQSVASALTRLRVPGWHHVETEFVRNYGAGEEFNQLLAGWSRRIDRSADALLCTLGFFDILATMPASQFLRFRGRLVPASGFGSAQFREIEYLMGLRELNAAKLRPRGGLIGADDEEPPPSPMLRPGDTTPSVEREQAFYGVQTPWGRSRVARRAREFSLRDVVYGFLHAAFRAGSREGEQPEEGLPDMRSAAVDALVAGAVSAVVKDQYGGAGSHDLDEAGELSLRRAIDSLNEAMTHREVLAATLIDADLRQRPFAGFLSSCLYMDSALLRWRDRHIRFVEGMIGTRRGTGGGGVSYLRGTVSPKSSGERNGMPAPYLTHAFPCLWQARSFVGTTVA